MEGADEPPLHQAFSPPRRNNLNMFFGNGHSGGVEEQNQWGYYGKSPPNNNFLHRQPTDPGEATRLENLMRAEGQVAGAPDVGEWSCAKFPKELQGPQRQDYMNQMLYDVTQALEQVSGTPAFLMYGTMLGAIRDRDIMPWTGDIDLAIPKTTVDILGNSSAKQVLRDKGYALFFAPRNHPAGIYRICATEWNPAAHAAGADGSWGVHFNPQNPTQPLEWEQTWAMMDKNPYVDLGWFGPPKQTDTHAAAAAESKEKSLERLQVVEDKSAQEHWSKMLDMVDDGELRELAGSAPAPVVERAKPAPTEPSEADLERMDPKVELEGWLDNNNDNIWFQKGLRNSDFYPPSTVEMRGNVYHIPKAAGWMLDTHYGNWHVVEKCKHAPDGHCPM